MTELQAIVTQIFEIISATKLQIGRSTISILEILQVIVYLLLVFIISHYFNKLLKNYLLVRFFTEKGIRYIIADILSYSLGTLTFIIILQATGFNLSILAVISGGLGLGIGLGLQNLSRDFISGLSLLLERKIKIGHFIKFKEFQGFVK
jgi:small-conductance mechanosensitive channel